MTSDGLLRSAPGCMKECVISSVFSFAGKKDFVGTWEGGMIANPDIAASNAS